MPFRSTGNKRPKWKGRWARGRKRTSLLGRGKRGGLLNVLSRFGGGMVGLGRIVQSTRRTGKRGALRSTGPNRSKQAERQRKWKERVARYSKDVRTRTARRRGGTQFGHAFYGNQYVSASQAGYSRRGGL